MLVHIIGTTGTSAADDAKIAEAATKTAIMKSGNMSLGVNLLAVLTRQVAAALGEEFDIEIVEMHHNKKVDAPSGTALLFGEAAAQGRKIDLKTHSERGRDGHTGARKVGTIGFASLRGGNVAGEHSVIFAGADERVELTHKATDRMIFARGALEGHALGARQAAGALLDAGCAGASQMKIEWNAAALVVIAIALATFGAFAFGNRFNQFQTVLVVLIFMLGVAGVYSLSRK